MTIITKGMGAILKGSKKVVIPKAGHAPNIDQPEIFNKTVNKFLTTK